MAKNQSKPSDAPSVPADEGAADLFLTRIAELYWAKLQSERRLRTSGRVMEADFVLRQVTRLEVMLDLGAGADGERALSVLQALRTADGVPEVDVVDTPFSRQLDRLRRLHFEAQGDLPRPEMLPEPGSTEAQGLGLDEAPDGTRVWRGTAMPALEADSREALLSKAWEDAARAQLEWEQRASLSPRPPS